MKLSSIHPFPARMAPEIVFEELAGLRSPLCVLDPMSGSGTVLRAAAELGHQAVGFDLDPLAVLMSRVWTTPINVIGLPRAASRLVQRAQEVREEYLPWIDDDPETAAYVRFWFRRKQINALRTLSFLLSTSTGAMADALRIALSRIIITKERGASIARDTSHSRPHRVFFDNEYDVYEGFLLSAQRLAVRLAPEKLRGTVSVRRGDSRQLKLVSANSIDLVITSPPYLNAIDYLRGHRLALVWLGHSIPRLRALRARSIGCERAETNPAATVALERLLDKAGSIRCLPPREFGMVQRYAQDICKFLQELAHIVKRHGRVLLVVGNSTLKEVPISNAEINIMAAKLAGFRITDRAERPLPSAHRYLPLPAVGGADTLARRIRTETLLSFSR